MSRISYSQLVPKSIKIILDDPKWVALTYNTVVKILVSFRRNLYKI